MYQVKVDKKGLLGSWLLGWRDDFEDAPDGFNPDNADEWVKIEDEWVRDKDRADEIRKGLEDAE